MNIMFLFSVGKDRKYSPNHQITQNSQKRASNYRKTNNSRRNTLLSISIK